MMKTSLALFALALALTLPARADFTASVDAGRLTSPLSAPMQPATLPGFTDGSLLLLVDLGSSGTYDSNLTAGNFVAGTNFILAAGGFNEFYGPGSQETVTPFNVSGSPTAGDKIALVWFPQLTLQDYNNGELTTGGMYFGEYSATGTPDGGDPWVVPNSNGLINLNFFTTDTLDGGSQTAGPLGPGYTQFQVAAVPEPSANILHGFGLLALLVCFHRRWKQAAA